MGTVLFVFVWWGRNCWGRFCLGAFFGMLLSGTVLGERYFGDLILGTICRYTAFDLLFKQVAHENFAKCILVAGTLLKDWQTFKVQLNFEVSEYSNNWNKVEVAEVSRFYRYFVAFRTQHTNV